LRIGAGLLSCTLLSKAVMTVRNLDHLFKPQSVALIGASSKPDSVGATVLNNLISAGFAGVVYPVNPKYDSLAGLKTYATIEQLPSAPQLAIICTPAATVPELIHALGERGTKAAIVISAARNGGAQGTLLTQAMLDAAKPHLLRILGPNCVGLLVPSLGLNASFAQRSALPGKLAFVSQSGALVTAVLDWASARGIGFSKFISLGDSVDVDFGDVLDYLASDSETRAILLYIEGVRQARKFMSAARAAARSKPVIVVKAGRAAEGARAASSHTGALAGSDAVYDAAIRRAGMLRVFTTEQLFGAVETLAHARPFHGERLAIMTNGGGPGVMATDELISSGGQLATLSESTRAQLDAVLPAGWSKGNPVDIIGDAPTARYLQALQVLQQDAQSDALLFIHAPTAIVASADIATTLLPALQQLPRTVLACWLGGDSVAQARQLFTQAGIACYDTPEQAVRGFMQIVDYGRNQNLLMQVPPSLADEFTPDTAQAQAVIAQAVAAGQTILTEPQAKMVLAAYGIPVVATQVAGSIEAAVMAAQEIGFPVALKILSPQVTHKTEVGGVSLDLETPDALRAAAGAMSKRLRQLRPGVRPNYLIWSGWYRR
jgi:acetyltransferase